MLTLRNMNYFIYTSHYVNFVNFSFIFLVKVHSLKCYECQASTSPDDCLSQETQVTCPSYLNNCGSLAVKFEAAGVSAQAYAKGALLNFKSVS